MLPTETANLSPEQRKQVHPDFLVNEKAYLQMRDQLLVQYAGNWVAILNGQVIAADRNVLRLMEIVEPQGGHPYIALVGGEENAVFRVRRTEFGYDDTYQPFPLPRLMAKSGIERKPLQSSMPMLFRTPARTFPFCLIAIARRLTFQFKLHRWFGGRRNRQSGQCALLSWQGRN